MTQTRLPTNPRPAPWWWPRPRRKTKPAAVPASVWPPMELRLPSDEELNRLATASPVARSAVEPSREAPACEVASGATSEPSGAIRPSGGIDGSGGERGPLPTPWEECGPHDSRRLTRFSKTLGATVDKTVAIRLHFGRQYYREVPCDRNQVGYARAMFPTAQAARFRRIPRGRRARSRSC